jgi:hypothetical protein
VIGKRLPDLRGETHHFWIAEFTSRWVRGCTLQVSGNKLSDFDKISNFSELYSYRKASVGSTREARRAGR